MNIKEAESNFLGGFLKSLGQFSGKEIATILAPIFVSLLGYIKISRIEPLLDFVPRQVLSIALGLSLSILILFVLKYQRLKSKTTKDIIDDYRFNTTLGIYMKKDSGEKVYYCSSCILQQPRIISPLQESEDGWRCQRKGCEEFYRNPDYKEPPFSLHEPRPWDKY